MSLESRNFGQDLAIQKYLRIMKRVMMRMMMRRRTRTRRRVMMMLMMRMTIVLIGKLGAAIS